jgi:hypothetical protein
MADVSSSDATNHVGGLLLSPSAIFEAFPQYGNT